MSVLLALPLLFAHCPRNKMTHAAAFAVVPALSSAMDAEGAGPRALKVTIEIETFTLAERLDDVTFEDARDRLLSGGAGCFLLFRDKPGAWALVAFVPDDAPARTKMLYSSSRATLVRALGGADVIQVERHFASLDEVEHPFPGAQSERGRVAEQRVLMTEVERLKLDADRLQAIEQAGDKTTSMSGLSFPLTVDAKSQLDDFIAGGIGVLLLAIEGETVALRATAASGTSPSQLDALVDPTQGACYCLYRWAHERDGSARAPVVFLYFCPEGAPIRSKMLHASTKGQFITALVTTRGAIERRRRVRTAPRRRARDAGRAHAPSQRACIAVACTQGELQLEIAKSLEGLEPSEVTEAELESQLYAADAAANAAAPVITKAAPRGGRKLVSRQKRAEAE